MSFPDTMFSRFKVVISSGVVQGSSGGNADILYQGDLVPPFPEVGLNFCLFSNQHSAQQGQQLLDSGMAPYPLRLINFADKFSDGET